MRFARGLHPSFGSGTSELTLTVTRSIVDPTNGLLLRMAMRFSRTAIRLGIVGQGHLLQVRQPVLVLDVRLEQIRRNLFHAADEAAPAVDEAGVVWIHDVPRGRTNAMQS
ncbi:hypothetical protein [Variovorax jilinensis]|uniref:hypothetical protein n=1 Tax=Variovorax jilinensis TaxID=3053513 RepID=UPI0025767ABC|nr:hypothetical protein [Variovorax sp. J22P168]